MFRRALIVFAKEPQAGKVKTRLCPPFSYEEARDLYTCFLKDAFVQYARIAAETSLDVLIFSAPDTAFFEKLAPAGIAGIHAQTGHDLGERMLLAFRQVFQSGYTQAAVIGTDHPTLPDEIIKKTFQQLETSDAVIGPACDGGYYLLGLKKAHPQYFEAIAWSTPEVFKTTKARFDALQEKCHVLPEWYDVDDADSLERMIREIRNDQLEHRPEHTMSFLEKSGKLKFSEPAW